jgi:hypothetical protein
MSPASQSTHDHRRSPDPRPAAAMPLLEEAPAAAAVPLPGESPAVESAHEEKCR